MVGIHHDRCSCRCVDGEDVIGSILLGIGALACFVLAAFTKLEGHGTTSVAIVSLVGNVVLRLGLAAIGAWLTALAAGALVS